MADGGQQTAAWSATCPLLALLCCLPCLEWHELKPKSLYYQDLRLRPATDAAEWTLRRKPRMAANGDRRASIPVGDD